MDKKSNTEDLNSVISQLDLTDCTDKTSPNTAEYIFCSGAHGIFMRLDILAIKKS